MNIISVVIIAVKENGGSGQREISEGKEGVLESRVALLTKWPLNGDLTSLRQKVVGR